MELSVAAEFAELPVAPAVSVVPEEAEAEKVAAEEIEAAAGEAAAAEAEAAEAEEVEAGPVLVLDPINPAQESALEKTLALTLDIVGKAGRYPSLRNAFQQSGNSCAAPSTAGLRVTRGRAKCGILQPQIVKNCSGACAPIELMHRPPCPMPF